MYFNSHPAYMGSDFALPPLTSNAILAKKIYDTTGDKSMKFLGISWNDALVSKMNSIYAQGKTAGLPDSSILLNLVNIGKASPAVADSYMTFKTGKADIGIDTVLSSSLNAVNSTVKGAGTIAENADSTIKIALITAGVLGVGYLAWQLSDNKNPFSHKGATA